MIMALDGSVPRDGENHKYSSVPDCAPYQAPSALLVSVSVSTIAGLLPSALILRLTAENPNALLWIVVKFRKCSLRPTHQ